MSSRCQAWGSPRMRLTLRVVLRHEHVFRLGGAKRKAASSRPRAGGLLVCQWLAAQSRHCLPAMESLVWWRPRASPCGGTPPWPTPCGPQRSLGWPSARLLTNGFCQVVHRLPRVSLTLRKILSHTLTGGKWPVVWVFGAETPAGCPYMWGLCDSQPTYMRVYAMAQPNICRSPRRPLGLKCHQPQRQNRQMVTNHHV